VIDMMGLMAALVGKAIGVEWLHRRKQKKLAATVAIERDRSAEHPRELSPLPKLLSGPVEDVGRTRSH
jgi:hypothetical protein